MPLDTEKIFAQAEGAASKQTDAAEGSFLSVITFLWDKELYGLPVSDVREVNRVSISSVTPVPGLPPTLLGAMNLRGEILPVADLRPLLGLALNQNTLTSRLIIVDYGSEHVGFLVDAVNDILEIPVPTGSAAVSDLIAGQMVLPGGQLLNLLDLKRALVAVAEGPRG